MILPRLFGVVAVLVCAEPVLDAAPKINCKRDFEKAIKNRNKTAARGESGYIGMLENLLQQCPSEKDLIQNELDSAKQRGRLSALQAQERKLGADVKSSSGRFTIDLRPDSSRKIDYGDLWSGLTISQRGSSLYWSEGSLLAVGNTAAVSFGDGAIYRFNGQVDLSLIPHFGIHGIRVLGEGDENDRLTFVMLKGALVYLRGKGKVIEVSGKETIFDGTLPLAQEPLAGVGGRSISAGSSDKASDACSVATPDSIQATLGLQIQPGRSLGRGLNADSAYSFRMSEGTVMVFLYTGSNHFRESGLNWTHVTGIGDRCIIAGRYIIQVLKGDRVASLQILLEPTAGHIPTLEQVTSFTKTVVDKL